MIQEFVIAIAEGQEWVATHTSREVAEVLLHSFTDSNLDTLEKVVERYKSIDAWNETPFMTKDAFERLQDVIQQSGELANRVPFEDLVVNEFSENLK